jgi:hypothetical protein
MRSRRSVRPRARAEAVGERPLQPTGERDRVGIAVRDVPAVGTTRKTPSCTYARPPHVPRQAIDRGLGHAPSGRATVRTLA